MQIVNDVPGQEEILAEKSFVIGEIIYEEHDPLMELITQRRVEDIL